MPANAETPRTVIQPGFRWDSCAAYLFDIDGTLLHSRDHVHFEAFTAGVREATGFEISLEGVPLAGNTDTAILSTACHYAGLPDSFLSEYGEKILRTMASTVAERRADLDLIVLPGVEATLAHLAQRGALLGLATGNLESIGWIKMEEAGLRKWFCFGGFSDGFTDRIELVGSAAATARKLLAAPKATVCVVGDTPRDIKAAHANHISVLSVATGRFGFDELAALQPEVCTTSLADLLALSATELS